MAGTPIMDLRRDIGWFLIDRDEDPIEGDQRSEILSDLRALVANNPDNDFCFASLEEFKSAFATPLMRQQEYFGDYLPERFAYAVYRAEAFFKRVHDVKLTSDGDVVYQYDDYDCNFLGGDCDVVSAQLYLDYTLSPVALFEDLIVHADEGANSVGAVGAKIYSADHSFAGLIDPILIPTNHPAVKLLQARQGTDFPSYMDAKTFVELCDFFEGDLLPEQLADLVVFIESQDPDQNRTAFERSFMLQSMKGMTYNDMHSVIDQFDLVGRDGKCLAQRSREWAYSYQASEDYGDHEAFLYDLFEERSGDFLKTTPEMLLVMATIESEGNASANSDGLLQMSGTGWMSPGQRAQYGLSSDGTVTIFKKFFLLNGGKSYQYNGELLEGRKTDAESSLFSGAYYLEQGCFNVEGPGYHYEVDSFAMALIAYNTDEQTKTSYFKCPDKTCLPDTTIRHIAKALIVQEALGRS